MVSVYDITLPQGETWPSAESVIEYLKEWCKHWVFQLEKSDSGYVHWQGRVSLIKKRRPNELKGKFCVGGNFSPTSTAVAVSKSFDYVLKADTRIEGPWKDDDEAPPPLTRQLRSFMAKEMYAWQAAIYRMVQEEDDRSIKVILDKGGNSGKSILAEFLEYKGLAWEMPPHRTMEDIMHTAMCVKAQKCYLVDMPRGMKKDKLADFYAGLESLKNGVAYDKRYAFKKRRFDRPQIIVFTNTLPKFDLLSPDRWEVWQIKDGDLVRWTEEDEVIEVECP